MYSWLDKSYWLKLLVSQGIILCPGSQELLVPPSKSQVSRAGPSISCEMHTYISLQAVKSLSCSYGPVHLTRVAKWSILVWVTAGISEVNPFSCPFTDRSGGGAAPGQESCRVLPKCSHQTRTHPTVNFFLIFSLCLLTSMNYFSFELL